MRSFVRLNKGRFLFLSIFLIELLLLTNLSISEPLLPPYVVDSIPKPCPDAYWPAFDSTWGFWVLNYWVDNKFWCDTMLIKLDIKTGKILKRVPLEGLPMIPRGLTFGFNKFWFNVQRSITADTVVYVYKVDTTGVILGRFEFKLPTRYHDATGITLQGSRLWITISDPMGWNGFYQMDTLGNLIRRVWTDITIIRVPLYTAFHSPDSTLFVATSADDIRQLNIDDSVAVLLRIFPNPFPPPYTDIVGITFDREEYLWVCGDYQWYYKLDIGFTGIEGKRAIPSLVSLPPSFFPPLPNPFSNKTHLKYTLSRPSSISLVVYSPLGQKVKVLVEGEKTSGIHSVEWDGKDDSGKKVSSGVYFIQLRMGKDFYTRRVILVR